MVLQVALKAGPFWEEVRETRGNWGIDAPDQLPPEDPNLLYPEQLRSPAQILDRFRWEYDIERLWLWLAVPGLDRYRLHLNWRPFMAALVLFQPPLDTLHEFAEYAGIVRKNPLAKYKALRNNPEFRRKEAATRYDPMLVSPLIRTLPSPYSLVWCWQRYYDTLLEEINERFLKPQGLDIQEMKDELLKDGTLNESLAERLSQIPQDLYVQIPKKATVPELRKAVELAASMQEEEEPEKAQEQVVEASNTDIMKVEIAYRRYVLGQSFRDMEDRYPNISSETFKRYASDGRKTLNKRG